MAGEKNGHPLPESGEARHNEIPEQVEQEKGRGEEGEAVIQPRQPAVNPDGEPYRYDDLGRGPGGEDGQAGTAPSGSRSDEAKETDMMNQDDRNRGEGVETDGLSGSELQQSQAGGQSGEFGGNRDQQQSGQAGHGGQQMGGGASASDLAQAGGSSGTGGYGNAQNQENHQGQAGADSGRPHDPQQSRGERFDEEQDGGRSSDALGADQEHGSGDEFQRDQQAHQDRGQSDAEAESEQR